MKEYSKEIIVSNGFRLNYVANQTVIRFQGLTCVCIYVYVYCLVSSM